MKRIIIGAVSLLLLVTVLIIPMGCATPPSSGGSTAADPFVKQTTLDAFKAAIESSLAKKADSSTVEALSKMIGNLGGGSSSSYQKSETYTQTEINNKIDTKVAEAIAALKANQGWITGSGSSGSSGSSGGSSTGSVTYVTTPASIPQIFTSSTGSAQQMYIMRINNGTNSWQYVKPVITLSLASSFSATTVTDLSISMSYGSYNMTGSLVSSEPPTADQIYKSTIGNFSISPPLGWKTVAKESNPVPSIVIMPISGGTGTGEFQVGSGQFIEIMIVISNMKTGVNSLWNISNSISSRSI